MRSFETQRESLRSALEEVFAGQVQTFSISVLDPHSGLRLRIRADRPFPAASTMKVGVLLSLYHRAQTGRTRLNRAVDVRNQFKSHVDGSAYEVPAELSEKCVCSTYKSRRRWLPLRVVATDMIQSSSNLATNALIRQIGPSQISKDLQRLGIRGIHIVRGLYDLKAFDRDIHNTLTADAAMRAFHVLRRPEFFTWQYRGEMLRILGMTMHRDKLPALLPGGVFVAQKSGYTDGVSHDAGLIYAQPNRPYAIAILTEGHKDKYQLEERIAIASRLVYDAVLGLRGQHR